MRSSASFRARCGLRSFHCPSLTMTNNNKENVTKIGCNLLESWPPQSRRWQPRIGATDNELVSGRMQFKVLTEWGRHNNVDNILDTTWNASIQQNAWELRGWRVGGRYSKFQLGVWRNVKPTHDWDMKEKQSDETCCRLSPRFRHF